MALYPHLTPRGLAPTSERHKRTAPSFDKNNFNSFTSFFFDSPRAYSLTIGFLLPYLVSCSRVSCTYTPRRQHRLQKDPSAPATIESATGWE